MPEKDLNSNNDEQNSILRIYKMIKRIFYTIVAIILMIIGISIIKNLKHIHDMGWSFTNNTTQIEIKVPEYTLAMEKWSQYDYENAEEQFGIALETADAKNGKASVESAAISQKLGSMYLEEGKYDDAYECLNNAYVTFRNVLGSGDGNTIIAKGQIAIYDIKMGNVEKGFSSFNELYNEATYVGHKIQICQMLAQCNIELGNYKKAAEWYDILLTGYQQFGVKNKSYINIMNDYGVLMMTVGNYQQAIRIFS